MALTSSFLYHFTNGNIQAIKGILQSGYRVSYSDEVEFNRSGPEVVKIRRAIPMVCFCDLPIFEIRSHAELYCNSENEIFGFGMKREWAQRHRLNPIIYVSPNSYMEELFGRINSYLVNQTRNAQAIDIFHGANRDILQGLEGYPAFQRLIELNDYINNGNIITMVFPDGDNDFSGEQWDLSRFELYYKPTHGTYPRNGVEIDDHPYYFEREWRYIPMISRIRACGDAANLTPERTMHKQNYEAFLAPRPVHSQLTFTADDIDQIIVDTNLSKQLLQDFILQPDFNVCGNPVGDKAAFIAKIEVWEEIQANEIH